MCVLHKECRCQSPGDASARDETGDADSQFLQQDREQRAEHSAAERDKQRHPLGRFLHEVSGNLQPDGKPKRRDEEPEKFPSEKQDRHADDDADDRDGEVHGQGGK